MKIHVVWSPSGRPFWTDRILLDEDEEEENVVEIPDELWAQWRQDHDDRPIDEFLINSST